MTTINLTGLPKAMQFSGEAMNEIAETLSFERNCMLCSLATNYQAANYQKFPRGECSIRDDIMEIKTECCLDPMREGSLLMGYFHEQLGEDVTHIIKKMTVIPSLKDVTFRFELYPVTISDVNSLLDHVEKLENENKKLHTEVNRLSLEIAELREKLDQKPAGIMVTAKLDPNWMDIKEHFRNWTMALGFDTHNHRKLSEQIKKIVLNPKKRTTVILWKNGDKTITKAMKGEKFDAEKGIAMAFMKYAYGNNGAYMKEIRKAIAEDQK